MPQQKTGAVVSPVTTSLDKTPHVLEEHVLSEFHINALYQSRYGAASIPVQTPDDSKGDCRSAAASVVQQSCAERSGIYICLTRLKV